MMIGLLEGEYRICLNNSAKSVQHAPQRGQVTLCNKIKETLDKLHSAGVIEPVSKPTPRISYMLAVENIRICHHLKERQQSCSLGELSYAYHRGHCNSPSWHQSVFCPRCKEWVLACQIGRGVIASDYLSHTFWLLSLV